MKDQNKFTYERVAIDSLKPMPKNTRKHSERNISVIAESLRRFGQQKNIVVTEDDIVLAGNGTVEAAKKLGWDTIDIKRSNLKASDAKAYSLTDNRSAELAEYDNDSLAEALAELEAEEWDLDGLGWNSAEVAFFNKQSSESIEDAWEDMPEFDQEDKKSFRHVIVHFDDNEAVAKFFKSIDQSHTEKTKSIWYPQKERMDTESRRYD